MAAWASWSPGEKQAASFLTKRGVRILARGVANAFGEIDLVGMEGDTIVFVEVRTRRSLDAGHPAESVTPQKQARLTRAALAFLKQKNLLDRRSRFDVVALIWPEGAKAPQYRALQERVRAGRARPILFLMNPIA